MNGEILTEDGLVGRLATPGDSMTALPVLVLHGSNGSLDTTALVADALASRGHLALALQYFGGPGLPPDLVEVPLEYVSRGIDFLVERSGSPRVGVVGISKGGELALLMGSRSRRIAAVVGVVPSSHVWQGIRRSGMPPRKSSWTLGGKPIPFATFRRPGPRFLFEMMTRRPLTMKDLHAPLREESDAAIPVERIDGPILLASGTEDRIWPSTAFCELVMKRLQERGFTYDHDHIRCEGAGHSIGVLTASAASSTVFEMPGSRMRLNLGGSVELNADWRQKIWAKTYGFLSALSQEPALCQPATPST